MSSSDNLRVCFESVEDGFEFTFEQMWKTMKIFLEERGVECRTPKDCLKEGFRTGLIVLSRLEKPSI